MTTRFHRMRPCRLLPVLTVLVSLFLPSESSAFIRRDLSPDASFLAAETCRNVPVDPDMKDPWGDWNIWNVATWGVANGVGYKWYDSLNPAHESTGFKGSVKGAVGGATIYANELTFGKIGSLDARASGYRGAEYTAALVASRVSRTAVIAAGTGGALGVLGNAAANGSTAAQVVHGGAQLGLAGMAAESSGQNLGEASVDFQTGHGVQGTVKAGLGVLDALSAVSGARTGLRDLEAAAPKVVNAINEALPTSLDPRSGSVLNPFAKNSPNPLTGEGYGVADPPVRLQGEWSDADFRAALRGRTPPGLGSPDVHHAGQMPGSAIHEVVPGLHQGNKALHPNRFNQGVTPEMRRQDRNLHWWYRAREQGADKLYPDAIYD